MPKESGFQNKPKTHQVAFELETPVSISIREQAAKDFITPSDQIRKLLGLSYSPPKRPRLTVSLSEIDYQILGKKFDIDPEDKHAIKKRIAKELSEKSV